MDIAALLAQLASGERTAVDVVRASLTRIEAEDDVYRAVLALSPDALATAERLDGAPADGRGALHGVPVLIKDNIETREMATTAGAHALAGLETGRDATAMARLRAAGSVMLGKANLSEWANFRSERSSSGWSGLGGQTRNAIVPARSPCGSSSGSAVAVARGYVPLAIGTETNGSIICPAAVNGIVGFKPTVGHIPVDGIIPIAATQDTAGPMTRTVTDAALAYAVMADRDTTEAAAQVRQGRLDGQRIGVVRSATGYHEGVDALFEQALEDLRGAGAIVVDDLVLEPFDGFGSDSYKVLLHEFRHYLDLWFDSLPEAPAVNSLARLIEFNEAHSAETMPYFRQDIFEKALATDGIETDAYRDALAKIRSATREDGIDRLLGEHDLDALIAPTVGPAWSIDLVNGDHYLGGFSSYPAVAGYPHLTLPMGTIHGLPIGLSITAGADADLAVLALGHAFEQLGARPALGRPLPQP